MIEAQVTAREIRRRLMNPPNGKASSELEVMPAYDFRKRLERMKEDESALIIQARFSIGNALVEQYRKTVHAWARAMVSALPDPPPPLPRIRLDQIIDATCRHYNISSDDLMSSKRTKTVVRPRHVVMYLGRNLTILSLPQIGARLGGRDHTTTLHGVRKITLTLPDDEALAADILDIKKALGVE